MKLISKLTGVTLGLFLLTSSVIAQPSHDMSPSEPTADFTAIEQPLGVKVAVTVGGLGLIGLELWWFLFSKKTKTKTNQAE